MLRVMEINYNIDNVKNKDYNKDTIKRVIKMVKELLIAVSSSFYLFI